MFECRFCKQSFKQERTLASHLCVKKRRFLEKDTIGASLGFRVYQKFYDLTTRSKKQQTIEDFINSRYYMDFVKFGRYAADLRPIDMEQFVEYLILNSIPIDSWCKDESYNAYLKQFIEREDPIRAVERTILKLEELAKERSIQYTDVLKNMGTIEATHYIRNGSFSPWVLYLSDGGNKIMSEMEDDQMQYIGPMIDPSYWNKTFVSKKADVVFIKGIFSGAGL